MRLVRGLRPCHCAVSDEIVTERFGRFRQVLYRARARQCPYERIMIATIDVSLYLSRAGLCFFRYGERTTINRQIRMSAFATCQHRPERRTRTDATVAAMSPRVDG